MTSSPSAQEPLAVQVMRAVLGSRLPAAPDQRQAIVDALAVHDAICVRVAVGHSECEARCTRSAPVELWSVRVEEGGGGAPPLPAIFLLNAVRSYVHFSQLSAWLRPAEGGEAPPAAASYELLLQQPAFLPAPPPDATIAEHAFPLAADASATRARVVRVAVRYVQRARPLSPVGRCLQLGKLPTDEWLLPSPLPSPTGMELSPLESGHAALFDGSAIVGLRGGKHKATEPALYSPTGPAPLKHAHFIVKEEEEEQLVIEHAREDTVEVACAQLYGNEEGAREILLVERMEIEDRKEEKVRKEEDTVVRRSAMMIREREKKEPKKERRGLRRMIGGWEESVLAGAMREKELPQAGYTLTIVSPSAAPLRLRLATASLEDTVAACVARTTVSECERVRDAAVGPVRKMIRRRGHLVPAAGQLQMSLINAEGTPLTTLTLPYDVREMPEGATTILRHRVRLAPKTATSNCSGPLRYLVQLSMTRDRVGRCFVTGEITVVFTTDASVDGANVKMDTVTGVAHAASLYELRAETVMAPFSHKSALVVV